MEDEAVGRSLAQGGAYPFIFEGLVVCVFGRQEPRASGSYQGQTSSAPLKDRDTRSYRQLLVNLKHNSRVHTVASAVADINNNNRTFAKQLKKREISLCTFIVHF